MTVQKECITVEKNIAMVLRLTIIETI